MIVARIVGGLGNQLFQYAAARALAARVGTHLKLDCYELANYQLRKYRLHHFAIDATDDACRTGRQSDRPGRVLEWTRERLRKVLPGMKVFREKSFAFDSNFLNLGDGVRLEGYWQSEKYFSGFENLVRGHLSILTPPSAINSALLSRIVATPSVSVHIRRGDYVSNPETAKVHGHCELQYYLRATELVAEQMAEKPEFFVFSDDVGWSRRHIKLPYATHFMDQNGPDEDYEDLRLIAACRHHIIANSTFSWWGAWLSGASGKIVVAPKQWFRDPAMDDRDVIPPGWVRI